MFEMAVYCTWEFYQKAGGALDQAPFDFWAEQASGLIDLLTMGRAKPLLKAFPDPLEKQLASACAQMVDMLQANCTALLRGAAGITGAAATDGYSEQYLDAQAARRAAEVGCRDLLRDALGADVYGLLYQGVGCCV